MNIWDNVINKTIGEYSEADLFSQIKLSNYVDLV